MCEKKKNLGILIGGVNTFFPKEVMRGIEYEAREQDINVLFFLGVQTESFYKEILDVKSTQSYDYQFNTIYDYSLLSGCDGRIINYGTIGTYMKKKNVLKFAERFADKPVVMLTDYLDDPRFASIIAGNHQGVYDLVTHLIEKHGCTKILHMAGPKNNLDATERLNGYLDAMRDHGLEVTDRMVEVGDFSEFVMEKVGRLLDNNPGAQAIVFANDEMAFAGYRVCEARGIEVGKDLLITGFDNCIMAENMDPGLTTVFQDGRSMGRKAVSVMNEIWNGSPASSVRVPVPFIRRGSCGCKAVDDVSASSFSIEAEFENATRQIKKIKKENLKELRKSWFIPYFARELDETAGNDRDFCQMIAEGLKQCHAGNSYLFLLDTPVRISGDETGWKLPGDMRLAAWCKGDECFAYEPYDRPLIKKKSGMVKFMDDDSWHEYMVFLLYSGEMQYGIIAIDADLEQFSFYYMLSLQLGISLRYHQSRKAELAYRSKLLNDMEEMREEKRKLDIVSAYDPLTGLLNRRGLLYNAEPLFSANEGQAYLIFADLDHLKEINDTFGHAEGDFALKGCANTLRLLLRETDLLARMGGDEFVCMVPGDNPDFENAFGERVKDALARLNAETGKPYYVEFSYGICRCCVTNEEELEEAISRADTYLYESKKRRRSSVLR